MANTNQAYLLTPLQQGILLESLEARSPGANVTQVLVSLPESLHADAWTHSWEWLARRHDVLRTACRWSDVERPQQEVAADPAVDVAWHDWSARPLSGIEQAWENLLAADRERGFQLEQAPLWRVTTVRIDARQHRVLFTYHHVILDARSQAILLKEVFFAYDQFRAGRQPAIAPALPFRQFVDSLPTELADAQAFWRARLAGFRSATPLPASIAAERSAGGRGERRELLSAERTGALRAFATRHGVTMNTLIQGAWALLLGRYAGEEDVVFGAIRGGRHASMGGLENSPGLFINTLPVRVALPPDQTVVEWLRDVRNGWTAIRPFEQTPLAEIGGWCGFAPGAPLFETIVSYQDPAWDAELQAQGGSWRMRKFDIRNQPSYPLTLDAAGGTTLLLRIGYDTARFSASAITRMIGHLSTLLQGIATHPNRTVSQVPMLTAGERKTLLQEWNVTRSAYDSTRCIHDVVAAQAARTPDALAVSDERESLSYRELDLRASVIAAHLRAASIGPGSFVGVCVKPSARLVTALLGVWQAGAAYVPIDPAYPAERIAFLLRDSAAPVLLTEQSIQSLVAGTGARVLCVDALPQPESTPLIPARVPTAEDLAYLIYTSGSTGVPKGVPIRHRNLAMLLAWHQAEYRVTPADRASQLASPAFDACVWELWPYLTAGASIHIPAEDVRLSPPRLARWLAEKAITLSFVPTPLAEALLDESWPEGVALRAILTGGDRLRRWPGEQLPCVLGNHYGPTECTVVATWTPVPKSPDGSAAPCIGRPITNTEAYVLDRHQQPVPIGVAGELYLGGDGLSPGYHRRPELTAEKFVLHPFNPAPGQRLYRTGDLVRWREDGRLEFLGRIDHQLKIRGHRIEPGEIESALNEQPSVRESLVVARQDSSGQAQLAAYILSRPGAPAPDSAALIEALRQRLPSYMVPATFVVLEAWPLTAHGKIDRALLPAPAEAPTRSFAAPKTTLELTIARIWCEVLGREAIGVNDDFFQLGGHSLRAAQVVSRLNAKLSLGLSVRHLFENSTIASLAQAIEQAPARPAAAAPALVRGPRNAPAELARQS